MNTHRTLISVLFLLGLSACAEPLHLGYDFGRAYTQAVTAQSDLTRASVVNLEHALSGVEAQRIRIRVEESTTDLESGTSSLKTGAN